MVDKNKTKGLEELWNILYGNEYHQSFLGEDVVIAVEKDSKIVTTKVTTQLHRVIYILCDYLIYAACSYTSDELKKGNIKDQADAFAKVILSSEFSMKKNKNGEDGIVKNTHVKYHSMLKVISSNTSKTIVEQSFFYNKILLYTYSFWLKNKEKGVVSNLDKEELTLDEFKKNSTLCSDIVASKVRDIRGIIDSEFECPDEWPNQYDILAAYTLLLLTKFSYPEFSGKEVERNRFNEVSEYKKDIENGIKAYFANGYVDRNKASLTNEDVLEIWVNELQGIINWCDDFSNNNPNLQISGLKVNFQRIQGEKIEGYLRAYNLDSQRDIQQIIEQMKSDLEAIPLLKDKLAHMRELAERLKNNTIIAQQFVDNMDEIAKTFAIGVLKNESRRED